MTAVAAPLKERSRRTLVLNADYRPIATYPIQIEDPRDAVKKLLKGKADLVEDWGTAFSSERGSLPTPKVIALREFRNVYSKPKFCRKSVLLRDAFTCQYCGAVFAAGDLSYDHVVPRSRGGRTVWTNIVMACYRCNGRKGHRTCRESGMHPIRAPREPTAFELLQAGLTYLPAEVKEDFGSYLYWNQELAS